MVWLPCDCSTEEKEQRAMSSQAMGPESDGSGDEAEIGNFHMNCSIFILNAFCLVMVSLNDMCV